MHLRPLARAAASFALALALLAAASAGASAQQRYPREPVCGERPAGAFPGTASYAPGLDTMAAVLRVVARSAAQQPPTGVFLLTTDSAGANPGVQVLGSNLPQPAQQRLLAVANAYLDSHPRPERMFFWVDLGAGGELPADHPVRFCLPHIRNLAVVRSYLQMAAQMESSYEGMGDAGTRGSRVGSVDLLVDRAGTVLWAGVGETSGSKPVDDYYLFIAMQMKFTPGTIDGGPRVFREQLRMTISAY
jgi:hypothetical protein